MARRRSPWPTLAGVTVALALVLGLVLVTSPASPVSVRAASSGPLSASVLFDGVNVGSHSTLGSAIVTNFSGTFSTFFAWNSTGPAPVTVTQAEIQLLFFGTAIGTSSGQFVRQSPNSYTLRSDFSQNRYIYEGAYEIQATLQSNGTTLFTQDFFIWIQATDHLTIVNIVLIALILLEIYEVAALGRVKLPKQPKGGVSPPPASTPAAPTPPSPSPAAEEPSTDADADAPAASEEA
jgi:hypothetical protein